MTVPPAIGFRGFLIAAISVLAQVPCAWGAPDRPAEAEPPGQEELRPAVSATQLTVDLAVMGLDLAVANRVGERTHLGAGVGLGGNFLNVMLLGGKHFSQQGLATYEGRDRADGEWLFDVVDAHVFVRREVSAKWRYDLGVQGSLLLHFDDSDDDPGGASFVGVYLAPYWGGGRFQLGSLIRMGIFNEPNLREFGINLEILRGRFAFGG